MTDKEIGEFLFKHHHHDYDGNIIYYEEDILILLDKLGKFKPDFNWFDIKGEKNAG